MLDQEDTEKDVLDVVCELFLQQGDGARHDPLQRLIDFLEQSKDVIDQISLMEKSAGSATDESTLTGKSVVETLKLIINSAIKNPDLLADRYAAFSVALLEIFQQTSRIQPDPSDRRFRDSLWQDSVFLRSLLQIYLAWKQELQNWLDAQPLEDDDKKRMQFIIDQLVSALAPCNFPFNPVALKRAEKTQGKSMVAGVVNWVQDVCFNQAMPKQIKDNAYTLGKDLAITPGDVVYRNEVLELIQYKLQTNKVHRKPVLLIPPQINKYYIFDLTPKNSVLNYLVQQGLQMFVVSWRNPRKTEGDWSLETYIKALLEVLQVMRTICRCKKIGVISGCAGGLTTQALLGYLAKVKKPIVSHQSLLVTALTPNNNSVLELFTTKENIHIARAHASVEGYMDGKALAKIFAWLRPDDLVWNYWINNYLLGKHTPSLDVLYWDNDSTRLPAQLHSDFIAMYEQDVFNIANRHKIFGLPIDYQKVRVNSYIAAGDEDYLMPWRSVYRTTKLLKGNHRFVLSTSGHVQSILRPPHLARTCYYTNEQLPKSADEWLESSTQQEGSWWIDWMRWLKHESGGLKKAAKHTGCELYPPLMPAPGVYVLERY